MIIWLTGISGSGKSTISNAIINKYKKHIPHLINIDGDEIRDLYTEKLGYEVEDRIKQIQRIQRISKFLEKQGLVVIVSALYSSPELLKWNRDNFNNYFEIFIDADIDLVKKRDPKNIYRDFELGLESNVVGLDIKYNIPINPDLIIGFKTNKSIEDIIIEISDNIDIFKLLK